MSKFKEVMKSYFMALVLSYCAVIIFMGVGPVFINGELAILKTNQYTLITSVFAFWPVYLMRRHAARKK